MSRKRTDFIIIHCADTKPSMDIGTDEINRWHRQRGFLKCGYHFVIRRDGVLESEEDGCRSIQASGAHAKGYNHKSIGVCLVGGMHEETNEPEDNFTDAQMETLQDLLSYLAVAYPDAKVIGHCEVSEKTCPNFNLKARLNKASVN